MSITTLEHPLPRHVAPRKFAQQGLDLSGQLAVSNCHRLCELLANDSGVIDVNLEFFVDDQGRRCMTGEAAVKLNLVCQRCLEACEHTVTALFNVAMVWSDEQAGQLSKSFDPWIVGEGDADVFQIVEDELILSLPMVAYHDYDCVPKSLFFSGELGSSEESEDRSSEANKTNPFKVLEQLKGRLD